MLGVITSHTSVRPNTLTLNSNVNFCFVQTVNTGSSLRSKKLHVAQSYLFAEETLGKNVLCGIVAGVVSSSFANPTDVLKVMTFLAALLIPPTS